MDRGRARVDLLIRGLDFNNSTLHFILVGEMKGSYKSPSEVENQVLQRAREAIAAQSLQGIFAFTSLGERFRFWYVSEEDQQLSPFDSEIPAGNLDGYVLLDSHAGESIEATCTIIKRDRPLNKAPVVPSQAIPIGLSYGASQPSVQSRQWSPSGSFEYSQDVLMNVDALAGYEANPEAGPSSRVQKTRKEPKLRQVVLQRRNNSSGYKFHWKNGQIKTDKKDWVESQGTLTMREPYRGYTFWGYLP